jgi:pimeloyl-ACP methyl ester carboxylesterase
MVSGKERPYFDYFYEAITAHPEKISDDARKKYVKAYSASASLKNGFNWYRAFESDAKNNASDLNKIDIPLLYLRGSKEMGNIQDYLSGLKESGIVNVQGDIINDSGHFAPEEQPDDVFEKVLSFIQPR